MAAAKRTRKTASADDAPKKAAKHQASQITDILRSSFKTYGTYTLINRAIPDFRDGLKPVQRRILWASHKLGLSPDKAFKKSATIIGGVIGHYHPHGDESSYKALVGLVNSVVPLIAHSGNFGSPALGMAPAAFRYTEAKLSQASQDLLLDRSALAVTDMVSNFDGSLDEPVVLPARLPILLLNGASGISVGTTTEIPSFEVNSVIKLLKLAIGRKDFAVTATECAKTLKLVNRDGGHVKSTTKELAEVWGQGHGRVAWECDYALDAKARTVTITGMAPDWSRNQLDKIHEMPNVKYVRNLASGDDLRFEIGLKTSVKVADFEAAVAPIIARLQSAVTYRIHVTERSRTVDSEGLVDSTAVFFRTSLPELIANWLKWRVSMVKAAAANEKSIFADKRRREEVLLLAIGNLAALTKIMTNAKLKDKRAVIAKTLKITREEADIIWETPFGRFDRLSAPEQQAKIKALLKQEQAAASDERSPTKATARDLDSIVPPARDKKAVSGRRKARKG